MPEGVTIVVGFAGVIIAAMLGVGGSLIAAGTKAKSPAGQATKKWGVRIILTALLAATITIVVIGMSIAQNTEGDVELASPTSAPSPTSTLASTDEDDKPDSQVPIAEVATPTATRGPTPELTPTSETVSAETSYFTVHDAELLQLRDDCGYSVDYTLAQGAAGAVQIFDLAEYPSGVVIGDGTMATIDGHLLGNSGVTFMITLTEPEERRYLELKDGVFFITSPENAEGWLRLRERHLACRGKDRATVRYFETEATNAYVLPVCSWLEANFPQSAEAIASELSLPVNRVSPIYEGCGSIVTGFKLELGAEVELAVPDSGCIDAPEESIFTGDHTSVPAATGQRAYNGTVRAVTLTYRPRCD